MTGAGLQFPLEHSKSVLPSDPGKVRKLFTEALSQEPSEKNVRSTVCKCLEAPPECIFCFHKFRFSEEAKLYLVDTKTYLQ